jgi:hypothetical protein
MVMHFPQGRSEEAKAGGVVSYLPTTFQPLINLSFPKMVRGRGEGFIKIPAITIIFYTEPLKYFRCLRKRFADKVSFINFKCLI